MDILPTIRTERAVLRVLTQADRDLLHAYRIENRDHLAPWEPARDPAYYRAHSASERVQQMLAETLAGSALHFAALDIGSGRMIASCAFTNIVRGAFQACHLGYSVAHSREGTGLMAEVARAGIAHMFDNAGLHRIMANHMPANTRSAALLRRLGFEREGFARSYLRINGRWEDMVLNSLVNPR
jgi:ribosomal-protein-alanine N-acetyltransferase